MASLARKRRRLDDRVAAINEQITQIDNLLLRRGPWAPRDEFHYAMKLARARLENEIADLAVVALAAGTLD